MFDELRALLSFLQRRSLSIDGLVFGIVCRMTAIIMLAGLIVVCSNQLIGKLINCDSSSTKIDEEFLNTFCLIHATYIVYSESKNIKSSKASNNIFPGIISYRDHNNHHQLERIFIDYYHWLWVIYFIGGLWFYFPHWLWKKLECHRIRSLVSHADMLVDHQHTQSSEYIKLKRIANYVVTSFGSNDRYMYGYFFCEFISFINLFIQMYTLNLIFNGRYLTYGFDAIETFLSKEKNNENQELNPISMIFPRMTKCEYRRYGPSGSSEIIDSLCMLPMNIFNDKFFLFIWFWIVSMILAFILTFFYRIAQIFWPKLLTKFLNDSSIMKSLENIENDQAMVNLLIRLKISDWFFLNLIANNVDHLFLGQLLTEICKNTQNESALKKFMTVNNNNNVDGDFINENNNDDDKSNTMINME